MNMKTTIKLSFETKALLDEFRLYDRQTYNSILLDLISVFKRLYPDQRFRDFYMEEARKDDSEKIRILIAEKGEEENVNS